MNKKKMMKGGWLLSLTNRFLKNNKTDKFLSWLVLLVYVVHISSSASSSTHHLLLSSPPPSMQFSLFFNNKTKFLSMNEQQEGVDFFVHFTAFHFQYTYCFFRIYFNLRIQIKVFLSLLLFIRSSSWMCLQNRSLWTPWKRPESAQGIPFSLSSSFE